MSRPQNVILIMTDQQHYRTLGCHGVKEARTPNLDRLAARGIDFQNHIVTNPVCSPSRGSLITGKFITEHGLWTNGCRLPEWNTTLPQVMNRAGWQTAHFGKLHLVPIINRTEPHPPYGFATCEVAEGDQQLIDDEYFRWLRRTDPDLFVQYVNEMYLGGHDRAYKSNLPEDKHLTTWVTRRSIDWLQNRRQKGQPFFLSVGYFDPHHAFNPVEPYASMFDNVPVTPPVFREDSVAGRPQHYRSHFRGCEKVTRDPERMTAIIRAYHAMCAHIDKCVGDLLDALEEQNLADNTVVIFTSDHGELLGNHGLLWKGPYLLDDLMKVPLLIAVPGRDLRGQVTDELSSGVDLLATVQAAAGLPDVQCESGLPLVDADLNLFPGGKHDYVLAEWEHPRHSSSSSLRMIRTKEHKLVHYANSDEGELYDLRNDPNEFANEYGNPKFAAVREELFRRLAAHYLSYRPRIRFEGGW